MRLGFILPTWETEGVLDFAGCFDAILRGDLLRGIARLNREAMKQSPSISANMTSHSNTTVKTANTCGNSSCNTRFF
jgi:hypothetical protein